MICLNNTDTLEGGASVNAVIDFTVHGLSGTTFANLAQGQLSNVDPSVLYTAGAGISIVSVIFTNTHTAPVTVNLYLDPWNVGTPRRLIPKDLSLGIGYSMHYDGARISVVDSSGRVVTTVSIADKLVSELSDITSPGADIEDAVVRRHAQNTDTGLDPTFEATFVKKGEGPKRTIILTAAGGWPSTTAGCAANAKVEYPTNDQNLYHLDFDAAARENAQWTVVMPDSYDGGTITAKFIWTSAGTSGDVVWGIEGRAYGDAENVDQVWGTAVLVTDTQLATANQVLHSTLSAALTLSGTPAGGELVQFRVFRDAGAVGDTLTVDARLIAVVLEYGTNSWTD